MRTLVIWSEIPEEYPKFFITEEDVTRFSGHYINEYMDTIEQEMVAFFYNSSNEFKFELLEIPPSVTEFDKVIACGFLA